jgi:uncharacterized protein
VNDEVIVDCKNCQYDHACCTLVRAPIYSDDVGDYDLDEACLRSGMKILKRINGHCVYFDPQNKCCKIWDKRPRVCRTFDCANDPRIPKMVEQERQKKKEPQQPSDKKRVIISLAIVDYDDRVKTTPMMIHTKEGSIAAPVIEIVSEQNKILDTVPTIIRSVLKEAEGQK